MDGFPSLLQRADRFLASVTSRLPPPLNNARSRFRLQAGAAIALAVTFLVTLLFFTNLLAPLDRLATDFLYHPATVSPDLAIIAIDKKSIDELGSFPWSRAIYAALLDRLGTAPRAVAFDLLFPAPSPDDASFAASLSRNGKVFLATTGVQAAAFPPEPDALPGYDVVILPEQTLGRAAAGLGHQMITPDPDGVVRRIPAAIQSNRIRYAALGLAVIAQTMGNAQITYDLPARTVSVGNLRIPVDEHGSMLLNFTSPLAGIQTYSFVDVFRGRVSTDQFRDKIIFLGGTGTIETEDFEIPLELGQYRVYNVDLQADLANMLLSRPPLTLQGQGALGVLGLTLAFALLVGLTLPHLRILYAVALTFVYLLGLLLFAIDAFNRGTILQWLEPAMALLLTAIAITTYKYLSEERRRRFLTLLFRRYLPAESVGRVVDAIDRGELPLTGTRRMVTVLYADLRGFGTMPEDLKPEVVLETVNRYIELVFQAVQAEGGTISKPMGDALIAIWNAPLDQADHQARGLRAALSIRRNIVHYQQKQEGEETLNFGIGLASGWAVLGNISAFGKVEYTLVGDTVNTAARISAFANNNQILSDSDTAAAAPEEIAVRALSPVRVRGHKEPLPVWEVRGEEATEKAEEPADE